MARIVKGNVDALCVNNIPGSKNAEFGSVVLCEQKIGKVSLL